MNYNHRLHAIHAFFEHIALLLWSCPKSGVSNMPLSLFMTVVRFCPRVLIIHRQSADIHQLPHCNPPHLQWLTSRDYFETHGHLEVTNVIGTSEKGPIPEGSFLLTWVYFWAGPNLRTGPEGELWNLESSA